MGIKSVASAVLSCMGLFTVTQQPTNIGVLRTVRGIMGGGKRRNTGTEGLGAFTSVNPYQFDVALAPVSNSAFPCYYYIIRLAEIL